MKNIYAYYINVVCLYISPCLFFCFSVYSWSQYFAVLISVFFVWALCAYCLKRTAFHRWQFIKHIVVSILFAVSLLNPLTITIISWRINGFAP